MTTIKAFIKKHPMSIYYALTFAISWGAILVATILKGMPATMAQFDAMVSVLIPATLLGPSISGLLMIGLVDGRPGFRDLGSRLGRWCVSARWYAIALLLAPLTYMALLMSLSAFSTVYLPGLFTSDDKTARLIMGFVSAVVVGICEELGWTGFVTPKFRQRYNVLATGIIIGVLWGIWHIVPMAIVPSLVLSAPLSSTIYIAVRTANFLVGGLIAFRVLMLWVYDNTQSLLVLILMHTSLTAANMIIGPESATGTSALIYDFAIAAGMWIIVAVIVMVNHGQLESRKSNLAR